jgi:hypothetical protein
MHQSERLDVMGRLSPVVYKNHMTPRVFQVILCLSFQIFSFHISSLPNIPSRRVNPKLDTPLLT